MHLLLITKASDQANPERKDEIITVPDEINFQAVRCYAWLDTLPNGASGNEGDICNVELSKDGHIGSKCDAIIKKPNHETMGLGDL